MGIKRKIERDRNKFVYAGTATRELATIAADTNAHGAPKNRKERRAQAARVRQAMWKQSAELTGQRPTIAEAATMGAPLTPAMHEKLFPGLPYLNLIQEAAKFPEGASDDD